MNKGQSDFGSVHLPRYGKITIRVDDFEIVVTNPYPQRGIEIRGGFPHALSIQPEVSNVVRITPRTEKDQ